MWDVDVVAQGWLESLISGSNLASSQPTANCLFLDGAALVDATFGRHPKQDRGTIIQKWVIYPPTKKVAKKKFNTAKYNVFVPI
jgi:hypothetical protein